MAVQQKPTFVRKAGKEVLSYIQIMVVDANGDMTPVQASIESPTREAINVATEKIFAALGWTSESAVERTPEGAKVRTDEGV